MCATPALLRPAHHTPVSHCLAAAGGGLQGHVADAAASAAAGQTWLCPPCAALAQLACVVPPPTLLRAHTNTTRRHPSMAPLQWLKGEGAAALAAAPPPAPRPKRAPDPKTQAFLVFLNDSDNNARWDAARIASNRRDRSQHAAVEWHNLSAEGKKPYTDKAVEKARQSSAAAGGTQGGRMGGSIAATWVRHVQARRRGNGGGVVVAVCGGWVGVGVGVPACMLAQETTGEAAQGWHTGLRIWCGPERFLCFCFYLCIPLCVPPVCWLQTPL